MTGAYTVARTYVFADPDQIERIALPDGYRVIAFVRGCSPQVGPLVEEGVYDVGCPRMADGAQAVALPMFMILVPAAHVAAMLAMTREAVGEALDDVEDALANHHPPEAPRTIQ